MKLRPVVYLLGIGATMADYLTSELNKDHPEIYEMNPHYNPWTELAAVEIGIGGIQALGEIMAVEERVAVITSSIVPIFPLLLAANNLWLNAIVHAKEVTWDDIVILYPEAS